MVTSSLTTYSRWSVGVPIGLACSARSRAYLAAESSGVEAPAGEIGRLSRGTAGGDGCPGESTGGLEPLDVAASSFDEDAFDEGAGDGAPVRFASADFLDEEAGDEAPVGLAPAVFDFAVPSACA